MIGNQENKIVAAANNSATTCSFCGKSGHVESVCYKKNGFPNNKGGKRVCTHCGKNGHIVDVCYRKHGFPPTGHKTFTTKAKSNEPKNDEDDQEVKFTQQ